MAAPQGTTPPIVDGGNGRTGELKILSVSLFVCLRKKPRAAEQIDMNNNKLSTHAATTVMLTDAGRIALAADALAAAGRTRNEQRRKALCEQAMSYLRSVVQA